MMICIAGGSGFIGRALTTLWLEQGHNVHWLVRNNKIAIPKGVTVWTWKQIQTSEFLLSFNQFQAIVNLSGASIADRRWTKAYKAMLLESRTQPIAALNQLLTNQPHKIQTFISASATGFYGDVYSPANETHAAGNTFLAQICKQWEDAFWQPALQGMQRHVVRIGVVLARHGGALPTMALPVKLGVASPLGSGNQFMSWITLSDLCRIFDFLLLHKGLPSQTWNATAPNPVSQKQFTQLLAKTLHRPFWPIAVPKSILKLILGEKSAIVLESQNAIPNQLLSHGFDFTTKEVIEAFNQIYIK